MRGGPCFLSLVVLPAKAGIQELEELGREETGLQGVQSALMPLLDAVKARLQGRPQLAPLTLRSDKRGLSALPPSPGLH